MMKSAARVIKYVAFGGAAFVAAVGSLFVAGYAFDDPGGWAAVGLVASYVVPILAFAIVAWRWPSVSVWVMTGALVLLAGAWLWYVVDTEAWRKLMDDAGPILGVTMLVLVLPLGLLGLRRPLAAGLIMCASAVLSYTAFLASVSDEPWQGIGDSLSTSRTVLCVPIFVIGLLFLLSAMFGVTDRKPPALPGPPTAPPSGSTPLSVGDVR